MTYEIRSPRKTPVASTLVQNKWLAREILDHREEGREEMVAIREFQLALRAVALAKGGHYYLDLKPTVFTELGKANIELYYERTHSLSIEIPEWVMAESDESDDIRPIDDYDDFRDLVEDAMDLTTPHKTDPTEEYGEPWWDNLEIYIGLTEAHVHDEMANHRPDVMRTLKFRLGTAYLADRDIGMTQRCASELETLYKGWGLGMPVPDRVVVSGEEAEGIETIATVDEFFDLVESYCEYFGEEVDSEPVAP